MHFYAFTVLNVQVNKREKRKNTKIFVCWYIVHILL